MKKLIGLLLVLALMLSTAAALAQYPVTLTDQAGREVTIGAEPQKIVSG